MPKSIHCPLCNHDLFVDEVISLHRDETVEENGYYYKICDINYDIFQCPRCHKVFINEYSSYDGENYSLEATYPLNPLPTSFDKRIEEISPYFIKVYNQAIIAEAHHLNEITGLAFRKAFEILVKDYAIFLNPTIENTEILQMPLSNVITKFFLYIMFQPVFQKITCLGNDHSHTFNKHENYDVQDLKRFIRSCVSMIIAQLDIDELNNIESKNN